MSLETMPEFNNIYDGTFPNSLHEEVHEDVSYCAMQRGLAALLTLKQHVSPSLFRSRVSPWWPTYPHRIANIPEEDPDVICLTVDHSNLLMTPSRANRYINERLHLKSHLPGSVPHLSFCVRGKFCHLAQGGLIVVKGRGKFFKSWDFLQSTWKCCPISGNPA
ncbi:hypothetical protein TNCV_624841 [Trichonephila clavipes]|nr:hypothetical protein TNCV_624841 [Trichonephila clavipes]